uniref:Uncharacterized protein n=1 Tax=Theropithecus gelada TaxID=9565 RepID=A0A8D2G382_THEGE
MKHPFSMSFRKKKLWLLPCSFENCDRAALVLRYLGKPQPLPRDPVKSALDLASAICNLYHLSLPAPV